MMIAHVNDQFYIWAHVILPPFGIRRWRVSVNGSIRFLDSESKRPSMTFALLLDCMPALFPLSLETTGGSSLALFHFSGQPLLTTSIPCHCNSADTGIGWVSVVWLKLGAPMKELLYQFITFFDEWVGLDILLEVLTLPTGILGSAIPTIAEDLGSSCPCGNHSHGNMIAMGLFETTILTCLAHVQSP